MVVDVLAVSQNILQKRHRSHSFVRSRAHEFRAKMKTNGSNSQKQKQLNALTRFHFSNENFDFEVVPFNSS